MSISSTRPSALSLDQLVSQADVSPEYKPASSPGRVLFPSVTNVNPDNYVSNAALYNVANPPGAISSIKDPFYSDTFNETDSNFAWSKLFPYELVILTRSGNTWYKESAFVLPIPPQEMTIQTPFAINQTVTMGGVVEEHNAAPIRVIQMSGTTGVAPLRMKASDSPPLNPLAKLAIEFVAGTALGSPTAPPPTMQSSMEVADSSGYNQFRKLQHFLEGYALKKKQSANRNLRLGLAIWKEGVVYLVTPLMFNVRRSVSSPLEYMYDLQFRAFARIPSETLGASANEQFNPKNNTDYLMQAMNLLRDARTVVRNVVKAIRYIRAAIASVMQAVRQAILFIKDIVNAAIELVDLPNLIIQDFKRLIIGAWNDLGNAVAELEKTLRPGSNVASREISRVQNVAQTDTAAPADPVASLMDDVFASPDDYGDFFQACSLDSFTIDKNIQQKIDAELNRVRTLTPSDFAAFRNETVNTMLDLANVLGVGDATVDSVYGISEPQTTRTLTTQELNLLSSLNDISDAFALLAMRRPYDALTTVDYIAGYASQSGIAFQNPVSKYAVPFPYDNTLEQLAAKYLGDPDRWLEIAAVNGLRDPYVDEVGFQQLLSADGNGNYVIVQDVTNLRIRQAVWIGSTIVPREKRHILGIDPLDGAYKVTLDGDADLAKYTLAADSYIHSFLPDTVNSMQSIYIPSDLPGVTSDELTRVPGVDMFDPLLKAGGIDLMLKQDGDLIVTTDGDCKLAYGLQGIDQRVRLTLMTPRGSLLHHPTFGFPLKVGQAVADMTAQQMAESIRSMFGNDSVFNNLNNIKVSIQGPTAYVSMGLTVFGETRPIDVSVTVLR